MTGHLYKKKEKAAHSSMFLSRESSFHVTYKEQEEATRSTRPTSQSSWVSALSDSGRENSDTLVTPRLTGSQLSPNGQAAPRPTVCLQPAPATCPLMSLSPPHTARSRTYHQGRVTEALASPALCTP